MCMHIASMYVCLFVQRRGRQTWQVLMEHKSSATNELDREITLSHLVVELTAENAHIQMIVHVRGA